MMVNRVFLLVLTTALLVVALTSASAAYSDVVGTRYERAVDLLGRLEIVQGFGDDTFRPENVITRAEFTAMIVRARGLESAAEYVAGTTPYPDVDGDHWACGYVNVAADNGWIKGYPDGSFRPSRSVSEAEVLAVLVRLLGYGPAAGSWPANYVSRARSLGIVDGHDVSADRQATRGAVAQFVYQSLVVKMQDQRRLLDEFDQVDRIAGLVVDTWHRTESSLNRPYITVRTQRGDNSVRLLADVTVDDLLGKRVSVWLLGRDVVALEQQTGDEVVRGDISSVEIEGGQIRFVTVGNVRYQVGHDSVLYRNFVEQENVNQTRHRWLAGSVRLVTDGQRVLFMDAVCYDGSWLVVASDRNSLVVVDERGHEQVVDLQAYAVVSAIAYGRPIMPGDIGHGLVHYFAHGTERLYLRTAGVVTGECVGVDLGRLAITVGGREYRVASATLSLDGDNSMCQVDARTVATLVGQDVRLYFGPTGALRHVSADVYQGESYSDYVVVVEPMRVVEGNRVMFAVDKFDQVRSFYCGLDTLVHYDGGITRVRDLTQLQLEQLLGADALVHVRERDSVVERIQIPDTERIVLGGDAVDVARDIIHDGSRWRRVTGEAKVFMSGLRPVALCADGWKIGAAYGVEADVVLAGDAGIGALVLHGMAECGSEAGVDAGIVVSTGNEVWVETGYGLRVVDGSGFGLGEFVVTVDETRVVPPVLAGGQEELFVVEVVDLQMKVSSGGVERILLLDPEALFMDGRGKMMCVSDVTDEWVVKAYDVKGNGVIDYVVKQQ